MRLALLCAVLLGVTPSTAQSYVELILDASGSMWNRLEDGRYRFVTAQEAIVKLSDRLSSDPNLKIGLRVFGAQYSALEEGACEDSHLVLSLENSEISKLSSSISDIQARGASPIAYALLEAAGDFPEDAIQRQIILITDGEESCGGNVVAATTALHQQGIDLEIHIIGFDDRESATKPDTLLTALAPIHEGWSSERVISTLLQTPP